MSQTTRPRNRTSLLFGVFLTITIFVWLLRGFGILTSIPGGVIWLLIILSVSTGILSRLQNRWRRYL